ncbi:hypothetical protein N791_00415 [Lysobacter defluvii IMMIB APB-9 = DSM 18482]|uniref:Integrase n=1 Tax=Lysobacter defluvii IMMIB APB-9 = DSM 18482 TaxID=1385515 RepID=A0A0A0MBK1_9GAMM|nr:site-specific integrase [Lysobacter defluvii]KGO99772.1 hypothetical protein N791_00415 [Lysobacter defluvii IMMIB APB-9 = DSM 18482]
MIVPVDLQGRLCRVEITRSLRTGDRREASRRLALWETHIRTYLALVRQRKSKMTQEELNRLSRRYLEATFDEIENRLALEGWEETGLDAHRFDLIEEAERLSAALAHADCAPGMAMARQMLPGAEPETQRKLARRLIEAKLEAVKAELAALSGETLRLPVGWAPSQPHAHPEPPKATPRVSEVAQLYGDERVALQSWSPRTEHQYRGYLIVLADLLGDPEIGSVTKDDMRRLGLSLIALPANLKKRFPGLTPSAALKAAGDDPSIPRLAPNSVNAYYQAVRSFFSWAEEHDYVQQSPASVLKDVKRGRAQDDRKPFDDEDLVAYFNVLRQERTRRPYLYWIPYIMAFSGCRLGEAAQLQKRDIRREGETWVIDINDAADGKRLKTASSARLVPLHPRLVELGLLEFVAGASEGFLWPAEVRTAADATRSAVDKLQKLLAHRLRKAGVDDPKKTAAHSFRHTIPTRLKGLDVPEYHIAEILGHESDSITTGRYGARTDVQRLHQVLSQLSLPI